MGGLRARLTAAVGVGAFGLMTCERCGWPTPTTGVAAALHDLIPGCPRCLMAAELPTLDAGLRAHGYPSPPKPDDEGRY